MRNEIYRLLRQMGMTENYVGFFYIVDAVCMAIEDPQRLCLVTKLIYLDVAKKNNTTPEAVERGIRLAISRMWKETPNTVARLSPVPLGKRPTNTKFLALLTARAQNAGS